MALQHSKAIQCHSR